MVSVFVHRNGLTERVPGIEPAWLDPASGVVLWVDLAAPTPDEFRILSDVFHFHPLAIEDAMAEVPHPKIELHDMCARSGHILAEGPVALLHRIIDLMVDHYRPEVEKLESRLDTLEEDV